MSRYGKITGSRKISEDYQNINLALDNIEADVDAKALVVTNHTSNADIHVTAADHEKLDGIEAGAQVNQPAFARVNGMDAESPEDEITIVGDVGIDVTQNPNDKSIHLTVTGESAPGAHAATHLSGGSDPIPTATSTTSGLMPPESFQAIKDNAAAITGMTEAVEDISDQLQIVNEQIAETAKRGNRYIAYLLYRMFMGDSVTLVCYGDSITYGYQVGSGTQVANPYPAVLQARLREVYKNDNITVINAGHSGWRTDQALANINDVISLNPDLILVMFGINDSNTQNVLLEPYRDNLTAITNAIRAAGSDLILLTPTPVRRSDLESNKRLRLYADMVREVAANNGVCCVDLQNEITRLWHTAGLYPVDTLGDGVHFTDDQYKLIADVVMYQVMQFNSPTRIVYVDSRNEFSVPLVYSPFVDTNLISIFTIPSQIYKQNYTFGSGSGLYLRFSFFCATPGMSLILRHARNAGGGIMAVSDNGEDVAEIIFYSPGSHQINAEEVVIEELTLGWHSILFDQSRITAGPSGNVNAYVGELLFRPVSSKSDRSFVNEVGSVLPKFENFKTITRRVRASGDIAGQIKGATLFSAGSVSLKASRKLVIEAEGKFTLATGITWFGNEMQTPEGSVVSGVNSGYIAYLSGGVSLYYTGVNNSVVKLTDAPFTIDYNTPHLIRVEHSPTGEIVIYVDGVQYITFTDNKFRDGYFGLWLNGARAMELDRYEYCYIDV